MSGFKIGVRHLFLVMTALAILTIVINSTCQHLIVCHRIQSTLDSVSSGGGSRTDLEQVRRVVESLRKATPTSLNSVTIADARILTFSYGDQFLIIDWISKIESQDVKEVQLEYDDGTRERFGRSYFQTSPSSNYYFQSRLLLKTGPSLKRITDVTLIQLSGAVSNAFPIRGEPSSGRPQTEDDVATRNGA